jgi:hypothetical protein
MSKQGRNLTPNEVEEILDAVENIIGITGELSKTGKFAKPGDLLAFREHRANLCFQWSYAVRTIDGEEG